MGELRVHRILQAFASFELRLLGSLNLDGLTRTWVTTCGSGAVSDAKGSEANEANLGAALQGTGDGIENCINRFGCVSF